jgi:hypothetical protein
MAAVTSAARSTDLRFQLIEIWTFAELLCGSRNARRSRGVLSATGSKILTQNSRNLLDQSCAFTKIAIRANGGYEANIMMETSWMETVEYDLTQEDGDSWPAATDGLRMLRPLSLVADMPRYTP